ncbi:hypothetical protein Moror_8859 [Moniliophthora roreri MCA 2997]|uniref:WW domain-containing protein n=2 Tax=Moniliophthora roreri TaxID=221103 RepID=V2XJZ1_MONRO|nr:hypothetical protein Moror_8859 [Moniliophthora roreri MCA 2997]
MENPDKRPLPPGWITQFDNNYRTWFYVNTNAQPPVTTWEHPANSAPPPPNQYAPPSGPPPPQGPSPMQSPPPPDNRGPYSPGPQGYGYNNPQGGYGGYGGYPGYQQQSPPPGPYGGYGSPPPQQGPGYGYGGPPPPQHQQSGGKGLLGGLFGGNKHGQQQYPPQQVAYAQEPKKSSGPGMGTMLAVGGAGLLGGALIGDAIADHQADEEREAYMAGYEDGQDGDFGGDW